MKLPNTKKKGLGSKPSSKHLTRLESETDLSMFLLDCVQSDRNVVYRGLRKASYRLVPSIGRHKTKRGEQITTAEEKLILKLFKQKAFSQLSGIQDDNLAVMSVAQHHGVPTRLMDWTRNPLAALFFAVRDEFSKWEKPEDSIVYRYFPPEKTDLDRTFDPFRQALVQRFIPKYWNPRIVAQSGLFTVHPNPTTEFAPLEMDRILISHAARRTIKFALNVLGVNSSTMFPDLDGLASHIRWLRTDAF